jgi:hypothetical protein
LAETGRLTTLSVRQPVAVVTGWVAESPPAAPKGQPR